jgi:hypothetical protein
VIVIVIVAAPVIVAVHVHLNAPVGVIASAREVAEEPELIQQ